MYEGWIALALMVALTIGGLWLQRRAIRKEEERRRRRFRAACMAFGWKPDAYEPGPATHYLRWDPLNPDGACEFVPFDKEQQSCPTNTPS